jgi:putative ABC transport system permease protein
MLYWRIIKVAIKSLLANRMRSFLAMLGIIIGVSAVISMLALGSGAQKRVLERIQAMGSNLMVIRPGVRGTGGVFSGSAQSLEIKDAQAILNQVSGVSMVSPVVQGKKQFKYYNNNAPSTIIGSAVTYFKIRNYEIEKGRLFTEDEVERAARVAVLGPSTVQELFNGQEPLGQMIKIGGNNFMVIGVTKAKGDQGFFNPDDQAIIPFTTAMKQVLGLDYLNEVDLTIDENADLQSIQNEIETLLRKRHKIRSSTDDDFHVRNMAEMAETATAMTQTFTILLGSVAAISLLVGGIGIMNIMLVTVTERTREIGIRKAIGAKDRDVLFQFLVESIIMSGIGGLIGLGLGVGFSLAMNKMGQFMTVVEPYAVILSLFFSAGVGIFFGFYPARRAAQMDPIDALQYE